MSPAGLLLALLPSVALAAVVFLHGLAPMRTSMTGLLLVWSGLFISAAAGALGWRDPLGLGFGSRLTWGWVLVLIAGVALSPTPHAGRAGLGAVGLLLLLPAGVARGLRGSAARRWACRGLALLGLVVSVASWVGGLLGLGERLAWPFLHHSLLATFCLLLLPLQIRLAIDERGSWRAAALAAAVAGLATVVASGSLGAIIGLAMGGALLAVRWLPRRRAWTGILLLFVVAASAQGARLRRIAAGDDVSLAARRVYVAAAVEGWTQRPWLGWGLGSSAAQLARFIEPRPGVNPPGEVVSDPHALPARLLFESGLPASVLALLLVVLWFRRRWLETGDERGWSASAGVLAALVSLAASGFSGNLVLWISLATVAGFDLRLPPKGMGWKARAGWVVALGAGFLVLPGLAGHLAYLRARGGATEALRAAARLDPGEPLYRWRLAIGGSGRPVPFRPGSSAGAPLQEPTLRALRRAADDAGHVPLLWLTRGLAEAESERRAAAIVSLGRACRLAPLDPWAPFALAMTVRDPDAAATHAAHALIAEPRLAAAEVWIERPELLARAVARIGAWPGLDPDLRQRMIDAFGALPRPQGSWSRLQLEIDGDPALAFSAFAFGRSPWPLVVAGARLSDERLVAVETLPSAARSPLTAPKAFARQRCRP